MLKNKPNDKEDSASAHRKEWYGRERCGELVSMRCSLNGMVDERPL
jgi:hypothetical protein